MSMDLFQGVTVCVDPLRPCVRNGCWRYDKVSHLFVAPGDDPGLALRALHDAASSLGLRRESFRVNRADFPHYDLSPDKHLDAIRIGIASPVALRTTLDVVDQWRTAIAAGRYAPQSSIPDPRPSK